MCRNREYMNPQEVIDTVRNHMEVHQKWFEDSIPLIASENIISPLVQEALLSDFHNRYAEGLPGKRYYQGNIYVDQVEELATELAVNLFNSDQADVRPIAGTNANLAVFSAMAKPNDIYTCLNVSDGAHISSAKFGSAGVRGLVSRTYPFDVNEMNIDVDKTIPFLKAVQPKFALFGRSVFLFPAPLKELQPTLEELGTRVVYDGAHVLGLIAGKRFQQPLEEGAQILLGSTHKTLPGPQGGVILSKNLPDKEWKKVQRFCFPGVMSSHHLHHMAGKAIAFAEHMEFGEAYADQIIRNAQALGQALHERDIDVLCEHKGFTASHTLVLNVERHGGGKVLAEALERANIITNFNLLPGDGKEKSLNPSGIRLGVPEITRCGMKESHMDEIADLIARICVKKEDEATVREDVKAFKSDFKRIEFCFHSGSNPYKLLKLVNTDG